MCHRPGLRTQILLILGTVTALSGASTANCARGEPPAKPSEDQKKEVRQRVREVLQEALDAMLAGKWVTAQPGQLVEIAVLQARAGDTVSARKTLTRAKDAIESLPDRNPNRAMAWSTLAKGWAEAGEVEELRGVIAALPEPGRNYGGSLELYRNNVILQSATALARTGKGKDALELAKDITGASASADRSRLLRFVALYHAGFGNLKEAYRVLDQLPDASLKIETLAGVIWGLRRNNNEPPQPQTLDVPSESGIALILHRAGDHVGARQCLKRALELAGGIKETEAQARGHASVACAQARMGDIAGALKTLDLIPADSKNYGAPLVAIARAQAAAGKAKEALGAIDKLSTVAWRVYALSEVGLGQAHGEDPQTASTTFAKARELIDGLPERQREGALIFLCWAQAAAKDYSEALGTAARTQLNSSFAYAHIAYYQAQAGDIKDALATIEDHMKGFQHATTLQIVAMLQAERGEQTEALAWARDLAAPEARAYALIGVAEGMLHKHKIGVDTRFFD